MPSTIDRVLTRAEFEAALLAAIAEFDFSRSRFYRMLAAGRAPKGVLRRYAGETYRGAKLFCANLADLARQAPDPQARLALLENLLEEEGIHLRPGRGLVSRPDQRHPALASRFVAACGGEEAEAEADEKERRHLSTRGRELIDQRRWLEAVAFLLIGQELKFATIAEALFEVLKRHGYAERDLAFFGVHIEADQEHGRQALDLVLDRARTPAEQQACIAAARAGAATWFDYHGADQPQRKAA